MACCNCFLLLLLLQVTTDWLTDSAVPESVIAALGGRSYYSPSNATFIFSYRLNFRDFDEVAPGFAQGTNVYLFSVSSPEGGAK